MKKYLIRMIMLLAFTSVTITSCSLEYRQHRRETRDKDRDHNRDHDDHHNDDHRNNNRNY
jgi:hypothetical protein